MGMSTGGGGRKGSLSEINVTPLVDVMLVLLVVFMVTTPIIVEEAKQRKVEIDLPKTNAEVVTNTEIQTIIGIHADYRVTLDLGEGESELVTCPDPSDYAKCLEGLEPKLKANPKINAEQRIFLMADRKLPYGYVIDVMARIKAAGITNLGMVTDPPEDAAKP